LTLAMEIIDEYDRAGKAKPDVVFVTDDDCYVPDGFVEAWQKLKTRADVSVWGVQIGGSGYRNALASLSDRVISIDQLNASPEGMSDLFRTI